MKIASIAYPKTDKDKKKIDKLVECYSRRIANEIGYEIKELEQLETKKSSTMKQKGFCY